MTAEVFRADLRRRLELNSNRVLLRVLLPGRQDKVAELTGATLLAKSLEVARTYCRAQLSEVVLLLLPHSEELFLLHLGLVLLGRIPAILAWPTNRVDPEKYQRNILHQLQSLPAAQLITLPRLASTLDHGLPFSVTACPIYDFPRFESLFPMDLAGDRVEKSGSPPSERGVPDDALFLQFSGGTTGDQKCVVVTAPMLSNQLERLSDVLQFGAEDGVASWLPLYHDMGLIACFWLPLWNGAASIQFAAEEWLMDPGMLFTLMNKYCATFCWLPNFAFAYLAAQKKRISQKVDLAHVRAWISCSEPVRGSSFNAFVESFSPMGVSAEQCQASYAMAENVFAVTQTPLKIFPATFSRISLAVSSPMQSHASYVLAGDQYVSSGRILPSVDIRIRDESGELCGDGIAGMIEIRGKSLFSGYWGRGGFQTESFAEDGWYVTGDLGFLHLHELYVIGRTKDVIISAGVNIFPEDIEAVVNTVAGIYPGRVVAFGVDDPKQGTENLAVVAEMRGEFDSSTAAALEHRIRQTVASALGISARYVLVTSERWIVKSTAGKISRRETRIRYLQQLSTHTFTANPGKPH